MLLYHNTDIECFKQILCDGPNAREIRNKNCFNHFPGIGMDYDPNTLYVAPNILNLIIITIITITIIKITITIITT